MGVEEQEEECEVTDTEFRISIILDVAEEDGPQPTLLLNVRYPQDYPDRVPYFDIQATPNAPTHPHFSVSADRDLLIAQLATTADENLGMAMVFTLVTTLKEVAEGLVNQRREVSRLAREDEINAAEREENKKFQGQMVTPETFLKWRDGFLAEMAERRAKQEEERLAELKKAKVKEPVKFTGRQLWEKGLVGKADEEDDEEEGGDDLAGNLEKTKISC